MIAPTITLETAVESDIFLAAARAGTWISQLGTNELRALISERFAQSLRSSARYEKDVVIMGEATVAAIEAWYRSLLSPKYGLSREQVGAIFEAMAWAQVALDAQLFSATSVEEVEDALQMHAIAVGAAYLSVGIGPQHLAIAAQACADTLRAHASRLSKGPRAMLVSEAEALRAHHVINAIDALMMATNVPVRERDAMRTAGARLEAKLTMAALAPDADALVKGAWSEYREAVAGRLESVAGEKKLPAPRETPQHASNKKVI